METRPYVSWELMNNFMIDVFKAYGVPEEDAKICADVLLESDRRGIESHGCNRFKPIYLDRIDNGTLLPVTKIDILKETPTTVVMDANNGMGMVASYHMMEKLIEKAKVYGMAGGAIMNSTHYGIAGYWTTMAEKAGMIGISGTNARPSVAPTFGVEPMMGTNPFTFTMPTDEDFPFNFDCATSIVQNGKIEFYERSGKETPAGLVVTKDGGTMTDSGQILKDMRAGKCALLSIGGLGEATGGYKGYGFTTIVEILSAAGYLLDLSEFAERGGIPEALLPYLTENVVVLEDNAIEYKLNEADEYREVTAPVMNAIDLSDIPLIKGAGFPDSIYLGIIANTPRLERCTEYLEYLLSAEETGS